MIRIILEIYKNKKIFRDTKFWRRDFQKSRKYLPLPIAFFRSSICTRDINFRSKRKEGEIQFVRIQKCSACITYTWCSSLIAEAHELTRLTAISSVVSAIAQKLSRWNFPPKILLIHTRNFSLNSLIRSV